MSDRRWRGDWPTEDAKKRLLEGDHDDLQSRLGNLVQYEAHLARMATQRPANLARVADGWERRFMTDVGRIAEVTELYAQLGYEVCADPVTVNELGDTCQDCQLLLLHRFRTIYTRRRPSEGT